MHGEKDTSGRSCSGFDYSTPESLEAMQGLSDLVLEIREEFHHEAFRKIELYERSLGLAVVPVLIRRAAIRVGVRLKHRYLKAR